MIKKGAQPSIIINVNTQGSVPQLRKKDQVTEDNTEVKELEKVRRSLQDQIFMNDALK